MASPSKRPATALDFSTPLPKKTKSKLAHKSGVVSFSGVW